MNEFITHQTMTTVYSIHLFTCLMQWVKTWFTDLSNTSSRKLRHVNKHEPSTGESKSYQPQLIKIEINSICLTKNIFLNNSLIRLPIIHLWCNIINGDVACWVRQPMSPQGSNMVTLQCHPWPAALGDIPPSGWHWPCHPPFQSPFI